MTILSLMLGYALGAITNHFLAEWQEKKNPRRTIIGFTQEELNEACDRAYERGEQAGQAMGRLNEQMGA
jgi:hypothetical protein